MIDFEDPRRGVDLFRVDDGELRIIPTSSCHIRWQWYIYGVNGSAYGGNLIANWTVSPAASSTVSFQTNR